MRIASAATPLFAAVFAAAFAFLVLTGCKQAANSANEAAARKDEPASTPLPTRQTTIDPVNRKLDAAAADADKRRADADKAGQ